MGEIGNFPELPQLASFHLEWADLSPGAAGKVAGSKSFPRLAKLSINNTEMGPDGMRELRAASNWPLRHLHLKGCPRMGDAGALGLAKSPLVAGLRVLCLDHCGIGPKGAAALAKSALLAGVRHLDLSHNFIGGAGLKALATSKHLRGLRSLDLINSWGDPVCKPAEGAAFMAALRMPELHSLAMWGVAIGGRGAKVVAESSRFSNLTVLMLESCGVTDAAARAIFEAPHLQQIINLNLFGNKLAHSAELLTRPEIMPKLARALLSVHQVPQELIDRLIKRPGLEVYIKTGVGTSRLATGEGESS